MTWPLTLSDAELRDIYPELSKKHELVVLEPRSAEESEAAYVKTYEGWLLLDPACHGHEVERS